MKLSVYFSKLSTFKLLRAAALVFCFVTTLQLNAKDSDSVSLEVRYGTMQKAFNQKEYRSVIEDAKTIIKVAPSSPFAADTVYYLAVSYFNLKDFDLANLYFSQFLEKYATPKYFEDVIVYKYKIAEEFEMGSGRHMFGVEKLPKWVSAWEDAMALYDEVIKTLPNHEITAKAMYRKAGMLKSEKKYKEAIDTYRSVTRRFPKNLMAPESYLAIAKVYFDQSQGDYPDKDYLEQARINYKRFKRDFPSEDRIIEVEALLVKMQDLYAKELWISAKYFEKKKKYSAAKLYYEKIARLYPESSYAREAVAKLALSEVSMTTVEQREEGLDRNGVDANEPSDQQIET